MPFFFNHVTFAYASFNVFTIPMTTSSHILPLASTKSSFPRYFCLWCLFQGFHHTHGNFIRGQRPYGFLLLPGSFSRLLKWQIGIFMNIPLWLIWLELYMVFDYRVGVNGRMELFTIHIGQNNYSSWKSFLHYVRTLIWWRELSSRIWKGSVPLLQNEVSQLKGARSSLLIVSSFDPPLVELSVAQRR